MTDVSRRTFIGGSVGALTFAGAPAALAAAQCVTGPLPGFLPSRLTVDCASQRNFQVFRKNDAYLGLAGAVSMTFVRSKVEIRIILPKQDRKSTRLNSSHLGISYAVFCLKKKK